MINFWPPVFLSGGVSTDPGVSNVASGISYEINNVPLVGTLQAVTNVLQSATLTGQSLDTNLVGASLDAVLVES